MSKRILPRASSPTSSRSSVDHVRKRQRRGEGPDQPVLDFNPDYTASAKNAARVDADPPLQALLKAASASLKTVEGTEAVVHWMRMADLRSECLESRFSQAPNNLGWQLSITARYLKLRSERNRPKFPSLSYLWSAHKIMPHMTAVPER